MLTTNIILIIFALINLTAFFVIAQDKRKAIQGSRDDRTPEGLLLFLAAAFGSFGIYAGMLAFRHKTRKWYFALGVPLLMLENIATVYVIVELLAV
jgi:uncharacterized membrane protein YsdA (DUF1294 family)